MQQLTEARRRLAQATGLPAMLTAALNAFEAMLPVIREQEDRAGPGFAAFVMSAVSVANGRDAIAFAPSLPKDAIGRVLPDQLAPDGRTTEAQAAAEVGELALFLARYLRDAAAQTAQPGDREACQDGARHAAAVAEMLTGTAQP